MPLRSDWRLQREGLTVEYLGRLLARTAFNPVLTLPLVLLARFTAQGRTLSGSYARQLKTIKALLYLGLAHHISNWLSKGVANNWTKDVYDWNKEIVVVTGGSDGIGKHIVLFLAECGIKVAVLDIQPMTYAPPPSVKYYNCDLASAASISDAVNAVRADFGHPTVLINNAGICYGEPMLSAPLAHVRKTFEVNVYAHHQLAAHLVPSMVAANHGMIVTVASQAAWVAAPRMADYAASKAAALAMHEALAAELATIYDAPKVRTVAVCPNATKTPLFEGFQMYNNAFLYKLEPETMAETVVKAVLRGESAMVALPVTGFYLFAGARGMPLWYQSGLRKKFKDVLTTWTGRLVEQREGDVEDVKEE
ncbi:uncharacterized protein J3D65DRAFT_633487 [Phyllosticta citribraziliensis]|uniref:NAD(P)-binding protein n=1 Tax=Phyllosticta citribraziliensis TaxID=989973 RepID=A0ABR1LC80_9PEZI